MKGSILIVGNNFLEVKQRVLSQLADWKLPISKNNPDLVFVETLDEKKSIGIAQIKEIKSYLTQKPFQYKYKTVVIEKAGLLTADAQNALLKTLEEPPEYANVILCVEKEGDLLPTILSRCQKIYVNVQNDGYASFARGGSQNGVGQGSDIFELSRKNDEKMHKAEELGKLERDEVINILKSWVMDLRRSDDFSGKTSDAMKIILKVISDLENTNVSLKLAAEYLLLNI